MVNANKKLNKLRFFRMEDKYYEEMRVKVAELKRTQPNMSIQNYIVGLIIKDLGLTHSKK